MGAARDSGNAADDEAARFVKFIMAAQQLPPPSNSVKNEKDQDTVCVE